ncbi:unnamed protein product [Mytilus edulis]|uniref:CCHC-type domain-containing protein n=1 Tax=Mytilus edulis TaxID=6550 RepID=A0A8S3VIN3_MYTED|nr:unnamed protein product [Mytilus edulis]
MNDDTVIETGSDRRVSEDSQPNGDQLGIKMLNVLERMGNDMGTLADTMTNMFRKQDENREILKSDIKSTGTNTSGYTDDDFSGSSICPKYGLSDANNEHLDPKLGENKPVDSFQIGQENSHRQSPFDQDSKPTSDLQFGRGNSPRPPSFSLDNQPIGYLQFGRGNSPRPNANSHTPLSSTTRDTTTQNLDDDRQTGSLQFGRGNSPRPNANSHTPLSSTPRDTTTPPFRPLLSTIERWESRSSPMNINNRQDSTRNIQPSFSSDIEAMHSSNNTQQTRQRVTKNDVPRQKLPTFDGKDDYEGFIIPFNRAARRNEWTEEEKLDRYIECLRGQASKFMTAIPRQERDNFESLSRHMENRQHNEKNEEFAEEVRRLVSRAYPTSSIELQEELAAEHFLKGHKNPKIAYEALNRQPKTVSSALDIVVQLQHNYHATMGRDVDFNTKQRSRRVTWKDENDEDENSYDQYEEVENVRQLATSFRKPDNQSLQNEIKALRDLLERSMLKDSKPTSSTTQSTGCYSCGDKGHYKRDCPQRSRSPTLSGDKRLAPIVKGDLFIRSAGDKVYLFQFKLMAIRSMLLLTQEQM